MQSQKPGGGESRVSELSSAKYWSLIELNFKLNCNICLSLEFIIRVGWAIRPKLVSLAPLCPLILYFFLSSSFSYSLPFPRPSSLSILPRFVCRAFTLNLNFMLASIKKFNYRSRLSLSGLRLPEQHTLTYIKLAKSNRKI